MHELIIEKPEALRTHHKVTYVSLTFVFWLIIFYLWQPLISLVAWSFGFKFFHEHMIRLGGYQGFLELLLIYLQVIAGLGIVFLSWAKINEWRFRGKNRRTQVARVRHNEVAEYFKVDVDSLRQMIQQKNIALRITDEMEVLSSDAIKCQP
ncbi:poly-beta-1,6-N-acetyl-D-glucosamine biosynthesis protein PgaD [Kangiella shandongensis]|uniref:poly-beta-1,6-N-acetyl-D-glucosamine biosynthesis protein PgaD n=1 Tax=Kangiella shandongensis TaxID=2763258 RepID=UPI001CBCAF18|nr:poly-beta-1,6-N-acetyl-D-glucosamine biosynthesis protein PgaD [Kangiella shandongensis]